MSPSYCLWQLRMWLADRLLLLGGRVQPEHRYNHAYTDDDQITIWREPVR